MDATKLPTTLLSIIESYIPRDYESFPEEAVVSIDDTGITDLTELTKYKNLRKLDMDSFNGDLTPLAGMPLQKLSMYSFNGDLTPLAGMPLQELSMGYFNGDLTPLVGMTLRKLDIV